LCCRAYFKPDHRNRTRQRYCSAAECQRVSKASSQAKWLADPTNADYHRGHEQVARVQAWRAAHPGYGRNRVRYPDALQDSLILQPIESNEEIGKRTDTALQDLLKAPSPVLAGLIVHLFEIALQDDMASTMRHLVQLGQSMMDGEPSEDDQASVEAGSTAASA
jgi:hypothetical protein